MADEPLAGSNAANVTVSPTEYIILTRDDSGRWVEHAHPIRAFSAEAAVKKLEAEGTYVAVPARSWKPVTVKAEQTVTLKLEPASTSPPPP